LGDCFPLFQTTSTIDQRGLERLNKALDTGKVRIQTFLYLAWGRVHESISDDDLADLLRKIFSREEGIDVAIEILNMRFQGSKKDFTYSPRLVAVAREVMSIYPFLDGRNWNNTLDYDLAQIATTCLKGEDGKDGAKAICHHLADAIAGGSSSIFGYSDLLNSLACAQPFVFLDVFLEKNGRKDHQRGTTFSDDFFEERNNPINQISDSDLLSWCENDPENRYPFIASAIEPFSVSTEGGQLTWKPIVHSIFEKAPNLAIILEHFAYGIRRPSLSWNGSWTAIFQERSVPLQSLYQHNNAEIRIWARRQYQFLQEMAKREQESERSIYRQRNERFE
jgi:hypothetical protein